MAQRERLAVGPGMASTTKAHLARQDLSIIRTLHAGAGTTDASSSFEEGVRSMEAGSWDDASAKFSGAMHNSRGETKTKAAQYLAAVKLCKARPGQRILISYLELKQHIPVASSPAFGIVLYVHFPVRPQDAASVSQGTSAKLMRFASVLKLDTRHQVALTTSSIAKNMAVSNYGYVFVPYGSLTTSSSQSLHCTWNCELVWLDTQRFAGSGVAEYSAHAHAMLCVTAFESTSRHSLMAMSAARSVYGM